ncbi:MAG: hypothetical protein HY706_03515 [Candidatus Hydrogenedentes bacterium]|nr:hypothetical protein [Candidatus Hydrogenedentota bacterium]
MRGASRAFPFLVIGLSVCAADSPPLESLLPSPGFASGWRTEGAVRHFDKKTIVDYIDGEAEMYFPYGFSGAVAARYVSEGDPTRSVQADIFCMGSRLDAFGIYSNNRFRNAQLIKIGAEGFCEDYQLMFYQDRYFVRLSAHGKPDNTKVDMVNCAKAIAQRLPGDRTPAPELDLIAAPGVIALTPKYLAESVLGYDFFGRGFVADAEIGGETVRAFVVITDSSDAAQLALDKYVAYLQTKNAEYEWQDSSGKTKTRLQAHDPLYKGVMLERRGAYLVGIAKLTEMDASAVSLLQSLLDRVPNQ